MIAAITENIQKRLFELGHTDRQIQRDIADAVAFELGNYSIERKTTALVVRDKTDLDIVGRYFVAKTTAGLTKRSLEMYNRELANAFQKIGKHIRDITADDVRKYMTLLRLNGRKNISVDNARRALSAFFNWAQREEIVTKNPMNRVPKVRCEKLVKKPFTEEELESLRMTCKTPREKAVLEFLFSTGCRVAECASVNVADIDFENRECMVLGKGNKERKVFITVRCAALLHEYLATRNDSADALFVEEQFRNGKTIRPKRPRRMGVSGIEKLVRDIGRAAGVSKCHPHRFRRTMATFALQKGMPIEQVSAMLGHEDLKTTTIYANSTMSDVKRSHSIYLG